MNSLPAVDYSAYYKKIQELALDKMPQWKSHSALVECSRGCWHAEKCGLCVFCGRQQVGAQFRSKSSVKLFEEIESIRSRHKVDSFILACDIGDPAYPGSFFKRLHESNSSLTFPFLQTRSHLSLEEIRLLGIGGCTEISVGVESLNSFALKAMNKGVTAIKNMFFLKWARFFGLNVVWSLLCGFKGEKDEHYHQQIKWYRLLRHLAPPLGEYR